MDVPGHHSKRVKSIHMRMCCLSDALVHMQLTACKVEQIETFSKKMLAEGHCIVIGLQSTGAHSAQQRETVVTLKVLTCMYITDSPSMVLTTEALLGGSGAWHSPKFCTSIIHMFAAHNHAPQASGCIASLDNDKDERKSTRLPKRLYCVAAGEARTEAMVKDMKVGNDESYAFDSFTDPAGLIMTNVIEKHCCKAPNYQWLLNLAKSLKLPTNPLVCLSCLLNLFLIHL